MVVSGRKLGLLAVVGLFTVALFLVSFGSISPNAGPSPTSDAPSVPTTDSSTTSTGEQLNTSSTGNFSSTTSSTTLFPQQQSFMQELSGDGYQTAIVFTDQREGTIFTMVWILVDTEKVPPTSYDAIFDQALALAKEYGAAQSTGGRLRVELSDPPPGEFIKDYIVESRDFDLSGGGGTEPGFVGFLLLGAGA